MVTSSNDYNSDYEENGTMDIKYYTVTKQGLSQKCKEGSTSENILYIKNKGKEGKITLINAKHTFSTIQ